MSAVRRFLGIIVAVLVLGWPAMRASAAEPGSAQELAGLWEARRRFGPDLRGLLIIEHGYGAGGWRAEIAGRSAPAKVDGDAVTFELPDAKGAFQGSFEARRTKIVGHWIQPATIGNGTPYASPVTLTKYGQDRWRGEVLPLDDQMTFYLMVKARDDGSVGVFLRNPERNIGRFIRVDQVEREGDAIKLLGAASGGEKARSLADGVYRDGDLSMRFPSRGGNYDFKRVPEGGASDFYPRGRPTASYAYAPPRSGNDGWPTGSLEDVGISREAMRRFIQMIIDTPIDSVSASEIHGVLIARHGKLVLEEYFHGEHREKPHDTRSASKSLTSTLVGAAIRAGVPLDVSSPVYRVMNGGAFPPDLPPRKRALKLEHLLTMSSGLDCDDRDPASPGNEDTMTEQTEQPDYYRFTLDLNMIREPGEKAVYCSINPNLAGGVLARAAGRSLPVLFQDLVAEPLQIKRYYMNLTPTGDAYMGGGVQILPRDFMKLGQLLENDGTWNGRRVLTPKWCRRATSPLYDLRGLRYGYLWWVTDYPYKNRTVRAFFAGGNGGQVVIAIPELDLVVAFYGGNYSDPVLYVAQQVYVPQYILPAVDEDR